MEQEIRFCTTADGVSIAYAVVGVGSPPVRALGWFTHLEREWEWAEIRSFWEQVAARHQLIRYDGRGIGLSGPWEDAFSPETRVRDLEAVIAATGIDRFALLGISEGGPTAVRYAVTYPDRVSHLLLYGSLAKFGRDDGPSQAAIAEQRAMITLVESGWGRDTPQFRQLFTCGFLPSGPPDQIRQFNELQRRAARPDVAARFLQSVYETDVRAEAARVTAPTIVLHRQGDAVIPFSWGRRLASAIPNARFLPLDGDSHLPGVSPQQDAR